MNDAMPEVNGYARWRDLTQMETRIRGEFKSDIRDVEDETRRQQTHCTTERNILVADVKSLQIRQDEAESFIDRVKGMTVLATFLVGTNLALVIVGVLSLLR